MNALPYLSLWTVCFSAGFCVLYSLMQFIPPFRFRWTRWLALLPCLVLGLYSLISGAFLTALVFFGFAITHRMAAEPRGRWPIFGMGLLLIPHGLLTALIWRASEVGQTPAYITSPEVWAFFTISWMFFAYLFYWEGMSRLMRWGLPAYLAMLMIMVWVANWGNAFIFAGVVTYAYGGMAFGMWKFRFKHVAVSQVAWILHSFGAIIIFMGLNSVPASNLI